jgi:hypothetical protein
MLATYGNTNVDRNPLRNVLYKDKWNMRAPQAMARGAAFLMYNEIGPFTDSVPFDGTVMFNRQVTLTAGVSPIDAIVDLLPVQGPDLPAIKEEETSPPIQPEV